MKNNLVVFLIILMIFAFWAGWPSVNNLWSTNFGNLPPNEFGDSFGGLSALFTGLAFLGLVYSIILQRKDLDESISEMKAQNQLIADNAALEIYETMFQQKLAEMGETLEPVAPQEYDQINNISKSLVNELTLQNVSATIIDEWISHYETQQSQRLESDEKYASKQAFRDEDLRKEKARGLVKDSEYGIEVNQKKMSVLKNKPESEARDKDLTAAKDMIKTWSEVKEKTEAKLKFLEEESPQDREERLKPEVEKNLMEYRKELAKRDLPFQHQFGELSDLKALFLSWEKTNNRILNYLKNG